MFISSHSRVPAALQKVFLAGQKDQRKKEQVPPTKDGMSSSTHKEDGNAMKLFGLTINGGKSKSSKGKSKSDVVQQPTRASKFSSMLRSRFGINRGDAANASRKAMKKKQKNKTKKEEKKEDLQGFLDKVITERGYSTKKYCSLDGGYHCKPTTLQKASYGIRVSQAVRTSDVELLERLIGSGLSPNPCNHYGESLVHMICRRGNADILRTMLENGCSLQVTDDYGRTPLHDACWGAEPNFSVVEMILESDKSLLYLVDCRGATPLSYVHKEQYPQWVEFLNKRLDMLWPQRNIELEGDEIAPALTKCQPHSIPIPDPTNALPLDLAEMVSSGRMEPEEAIYLQDGSSDSETDYSDYSDDEGSDFSDDDDDSYYSDSDDDSDIDPREMAEFCLRAGGAMAIAQRVIAEQQRQQLQLQRAAAVQ